jgi:hypothetical protein
MNTSNPKKGHTMPAEQTPKKPTATTGFLALLCAPFRATGTRASKTARGTGAISYNTSTCRPAFLVALAIALCALAYTAAAAQAGAGYRSAFTFASPEGFNGPVGLAVDNSADSSKGDVYVVDQGNEALKKFSISGEAATQLWKVELPGSSPYQATVDDFAGPDEGDVFVAGHGSGVIYRVNPAGTEVAEVLTGVGAPTGVAVDSAGDFFVASEEQGAVFEYNEKWEPITAAGLPPLNPGENNTVMGGLTYPQAVAVDPSGEHVYAATIEPGTVQATLVAGSYTSATLNGASSFGVTVAPSGDVFVDQGNEFIQGIEVADYEPSGTLIGTFGSSFVKRGGYGIAVSAGGVYVANHETGKVDVFAEGPAANDEDSPSVTANEAEVSAEITTDEETTSYQVQYGTASVTESSTPEVSLPGASAPVSVEQRLGGLQAATTYHYRFLVSNPHGHLIGEERTFTTPPAVVATAETCPNAKLRAEQPYGLDLPDCRAYEMVSPLDTGGQDAVSTKVAFGLRAALDGEAIAYVSAGSFAEPTGADFENELLSRRAGGGWSTQAITPLQEPDSTEQINSYQASVFEPELKAGVADSAARLTSEAPETPSGAEIALQKLYVTNFTESLSEQSYKYVGVLGESASFISPMGASTDLSHVVFDENEEGHAMEWVNGTVLPVGVANDREAVLASVGGVASEYKLPAYVDAWHAVSADGSRVYFTSPGGELGEGGGQLEPPGQLYVRVHAEQEQSNIAEPEVSGTGTLTSGSEVVSSLVSASGFLRNEYHEGVTEILVQTKSGKFSVGAFLSGSAFTTGTKITAIREETGHEVLTLSAPTIAYQANGTQIAAVGPAPFTVGQKIAGNGIAPGTTIVAADKAGELTLSKPAAATSSGVALNVGGECLEAAKACTIEVSASQRYAHSNLAGIQPARFWGASTGPEAGAEAKPERVFFTSDAELTEDAYTGTTTEQEVVTEGSFTLSFKGQTTASLEPNATPKKVQEALEALTSIGAGNVTVRKGQVRGESESTFLVTFGSFAGSEPPLLTAEGGAVSVHLRLAANLYEYELSREGKPARLTDLTGEATDASGEGAAVQGVVQISEEGSYVYFVATGALKGEHGAALRNGSGAEPVAGEDNLYLSHEGGKPVFVTTLAAGDASDWFATNGEGYQEGGPANHTAVVDPSGARLAFISDRSLPTTNFPNGYDNEQAATDECERQERHTPGFTETGACREVFVYDAPTPEQERAGGSGTLVCASCDPTGARPVGPSNLGLTPNQLSSYRPRNFSQDGTLFFDSSDALAPHAKDARQNVYEYENGHVYPLSDVAGDNESTFLDAGANGNNVFFASSDKLLPEDVNQNVVVWDARVNGGYPAPAVAPSCNSGDSCKPPESPQPSIYGAPASATFAGPANPPPPPPAVVKPAVKPKALTRAQKLADALKSCKKDKKKKKRASCEKSAHQKYGIAKKSSKKKGK